MLEIPGSLDLFICLVENLNEYVQPKVNGLCFFFPSYLHPFDLCLAEL